MSLEGSTALSGRITAKRQIAPWFRHGQSWLVVVCLAAIAGGCTQYRTVERTYGTDGTVTRELVTRGDQVVSDLHRAYAGIAIEGVGEFKHTSQTIARNTALNLAINDLAKRAGEVLVEEDSTLYNDQVRTIMRTRARNIVAGYTVVSEAYDADTAVARVVVRQEGERIASELARELVR